MVRKVEMKLAQRFTSSRPRGWIELTAMLGLILLGFGGCGDPNAVTQLKIYPVKGKVLLADGKSLTGGRVVFMLPEKGLEFEGSIESDGSFRIKGSQGEGAPEGTYKVRIAPDWTKPGDNAARAARRKSADLPFPAMYGDETTSGLTATVKSGDNTLEPFKLVPGQGGSGSKSERSSSSLNVRH
jgi:hypothetical protein